MKILFLGDVMGRAGRAALTSLLPDIKKDWSLDFVVVNGENATNGVVAKGAPGAGARVFEATRGRKILVAQVLGQVFMKRPFDDPFGQIEQVLKTHILGGAVQASLR